MMDERARRLLDGIAGAYSEVLGSNLVGVYAHGSMAFGCFRWAVSDIDFLVIAERKLRHEEKRALIGILLDCGGEAPPKGFEMSVMLRKDLSPFVHPAPFELHFSNAHLDAYREDLDGYCERMQGVDPDLAAHCMVTRAVGQVVCGEAIEHVFGEVPWAAYLDSIRQDIEGAREGILENPVYVILNLCRVLAAVRERRVLSKVDGGRWALERLEQRWHGVIRSALEAYEAGGALTVREAEARAFAEYMLEAVMK